MLLKKILSLFVLVPSVLLLTCSSDEESPVSPTPKTDPPEFVLKEVTFPEKMQNSSDQMAKETIERIHQTMSFEGTGCVFEAPANSTAVTETTSAWEYQWTEDQVTNSLKITSTADRNMWQIYFDGGSYSNWRYMDAVQRSDRTSGHVHLYRSSTSQIEHEWVWYTLENQEYKFIKQVYSDPNSKVEIAFKSDGSGKLETFLPGSGGSLVYELRVSWDNEGNGSWWTFDDGTQTGSGTW